MDSETNARKIYVFFTGDFTYLVSPQVGIEGCEAVFCIFSFLLFPMERKGLLGS